VSYVGLLHVHQYSGHAAYVNLCTVYRHSVFHFLRCLCCNEAPTVLDTTNAILSLYIMFMYININFYAYIIVY